MTFEEVFEFTDKIPGSFTRVSCAKLYEYALQVPHGGLMVEVGVDQGRSASLMLQAARQNDAAVVLVDSWESVLIDNKAKVDALCEQFPGVRWTTIVGTSVNAAKAIGAEIDLIHIDANHYDDNPANDCEAWLPKLRSGGIACFHDYESCFPDVTPAVDKYTAGWEHLGNHDGLAIRRKP